MLPKIPPLELIQQPAAFDHEEWLFEIKDDGFRAVAYIEDGECSLVSRNDHTYQRFTDLRESLSNLGVDNAVIDGEIVVLDGEGKARFNDLMFNRGVPCFAAFDLMWLNGEDQRDFPLWQRKENLRELTHSSLLYVDYVETRGKELFKQVCDLDYGRHCLQTSHQPVSRNQRQGDLDQGEES